MRTAEGLQTSDLEQEPIMPSKTTAPKKPRGAKLPVDSRDNPHLDATYKQPQVDRWGLGKTYQAHSAPISSLA